MIRCGYVLVLSLFAGCANPRAITSAAGISMTKTFEVKHVSVSIERSPDDVYGYAVNVETWPQWAHGIGKSVRKSGEVWIAEGPLGAVTVRFTDSNPYRVLDHDVTLPNGQKFHNSFRVIPNGENSEAVFSVFRQSGATDEAFKADWQAVENDLRTLKKILEAG
jgi:hypothetical protein